MQHHGLTPAAAAASSAPAMWPTYKKWFHAWEEATARYLETWLKSPLVLEPAGAWLTAMMRSKAATDEALASLWGGLGFATKRDQERTLHTVNQIHSRLIDLEEELEEKLRRER